MKRLSINKQWLTLKYIKDAKYKAFKNKFYNQQNIEDLHLGYHTALLELAEKLADKEVKFMENK